MKTLNGMAIAISGLVFAGAAALAAVPASADTAYLSGDPNGPSQAISQTNDCGNGDTPTDVFCQNLASQIQGDHNTATLTGKQW
ncbi:hypothetical protein [Nonomuraea sp. NPDC046570]|uniref:hypothetical protein n=1 Tax=Nonomuraea sp. NPDC046570 TaxID=3155255 RepID=UPI0033E7DA73